MNKERGCRYDENTITINLSKGKKKRNVKREGGNRIITVVQELFHYSLQCEQHYKKDMRRSVQGKASEVDRSGIQSLGSHKARIKRRGEEERRSKARKTRNGG